MTDKRKYDAGGREISLTDIAICFMWVFLLALMIRNSDVAISYMRSALSLCARSVIPSLFPFMVLSELTLSSGAARTLGKLFSPVAKRLFGVSGEGVTPILLGAFCGFPIGARCAVSLFDRGRISKDECERLLAISSVPSSAFLIGAVGISLCGSRAFGRLLWCSALLSALLLGVAQNLISKRKAQKERASAPEKERARLTASTLSDAISSSAEAMLRVCGFVVFFTAFVGVLCSFFDAISLPAYLRAAICSAFEMTGGVSSAAALDDKIKSATLAAAAVGWSGISVHLQISSICRGRDLSLRPYILSKLASGVLTAALVRGYLAHYPIELHTELPTSLIPTRAAWIISALFLLSLSCLFFKKLSKKQKS